MSGNGKQPFKKRETIKLSDLDPAFPSHVWVFWSSPTAAILAGLIQPFLDRKGDDAQQAQDSEDLYLRAVSELVLDCGESGFDLSTPDAVRSAFYSPTIDAELLSGIISAYTERIIKQRKARQKKAGEPSLAISTS